MLINVAIAGGAGGIGQPLCLLMKQNKHIKKLILYDIAPTAGIAKDLSHIETKSDVSGYVNSQVVLHILSISVQI